MYFVLSFAWIVTLGASWWFQWHFWFSFPVRCWSLDIWLVYSEEIFKRTLKWFWLRTGTEGEFFESKPWKGKEPSVFSGKPADFLVFCDGRSFRRGAVKQSRLVCRFVSSCKRLSQILDATVSVTSSHPSLYLPSVYFLSLTVSLKYGCELWITVTSFRFGGFLCRQTTSVAILASKRMIATDTPTGMPTWEISLPDWRSPSVPEIGENTHTHKHKDTQTHTHAYEHTRTHLIQGIFQRSMKNSIHARDIKRANLGSEVAVRLTR